MSNNIPSKKRANPEGSDSEDNLEPAAKRQRLDNNKEKEKAAESDEGEADFEDKSDVEDSFDDDFGEEQEEEAGGNSEGDFDFEKY